MWIDTARSQLLEVLARIDGLFINDVEARQLTGMKNLVQAARCIQSMGPRWVILKKGEHGCFVLGPDTMLALPAYPSDKLVDPTGAGDSFAGGILGFLCNKFQERNNDPKTPLQIDRNDMAQAVMQGTALASFTIESFSIERLQQVTLEDIQNRVGQLQSLVGY